MAKKKSSKSEVAGIFQRIFYQGQYFDYALLFITLFLVCFGLIMVYSTSSYTAELRFETPAYYLMRQGAFALLGVGVMLVVSRFDYRIWKNFSQILILLSLIMIVLLPFLGDESNGSVRWLVLGPIRFQPSEIAKLAIVIYTAHKATIYSARIGEFATMRKVLWLQMIVVGLIAFENLSTGIICAAIALMVVFVTSPKWKQFFALGGIVLAAGVVFLMIASYRLERIDIWLHPEKYEKGYQTLQSLYAIGSGGLFGKGLGNSIQKLGFIPESHNDYIFSVVCEELGLFGAIGVIALFMLLIWRCVVITLSIRDLFGALLVVGITTHIAVQVLINIAVVTNSIPPTGVPLPFVSYGGTALVMLLTEVGIVLSVSRHIHIAKGY